MLNWFQADLESTHNQNHEMCQKRAYLLSGETTSIRQTNSSSYYVNPQCLYILKLYIDYITMHMRKLI